MIENKKIFQYTHNIQWDSHYNPEIKKLDEVMADSYIRFNKTLKHIISAFPGKNILVCTHADNVKFGIATLIPDIENIFIKLNEQKNGITFFDDNYLALEKTLPTNYYNTLAKVQRHRLYNDWYLTEHPSIFHIL
jgi:broad specificity phosphatase PhoE